MQDPFTTGTWILHKDDVAPCDDGNSAHIWRLRAGFELLAPRMLEGQYSWVPVAMNLKGSASAGPANNAHWAPTARLETTAVPPLKLIVRVNNSGKVAFSLAFDTSWVRNLRKGSETTDKKGKTISIAADGATFAQDSWAFAAMTRAEYDSWCAAENRPPSEFMG